MQIFCHFYSAGGGWGTRLSSLLQIRKILVKCIGPFCDRPCSDMFLTVSFYVCGEFASYNNVEVCVKYL